MWPFKEKQKKESEPDLVSIRWNETIKRFPLGSGYLYHSQPVIVVKHNDFIPYIYVDGRSPGVWIEWFDTDKHLNERFVGYSKLQFLKAAPAKSEQATNAQHPLCGAPLNAEDGTAQS